MDVTWFAVDEDDNVAVFETCETGSRPNEGFPLTELDELLAGLLWLRSRTDERLRAMLPGTVEEIRQEVEDYENYGKDDCGELVRSLVLSLGVWIYNIGEIGAVPYTHSGPVSDPISADELLELETLDRETRKTLKDSRFPIRFREAKALAPGEFVPVRATDGIWWDLEGNPHPSVGREDEMGRWQSGSLTREPEWNDPDHADPTFEGEALYGAVEKLLTRPDWW